MSDEPNFIPGAVTNENADVDYPAMKRAEAAALALLKAEGYEDVEVWLLARWKHPTEPGHHVRNAVNTWSDDLESQMAALDILLDMAQAGYFGISRWAEEAGREFGLKDVLGG